MVFEKLSRPGVQDLLSGLQLGPAPGLVRVVQQPHLFRLLAARLDLSALLALEQVCTATRSAVVHSRVYRHRVAAGLAAGRLWCTVLLCSPQQAGCAGRAGAGSVPGPRIHLLSS